MPNKQFTWSEIAHFCEDTYGTYVDWEERFFECGECGNEPIYECDYGDNSILRAGYCPICGAALMPECEVDNYFEDNEDYYDDEDEEEEY